MDWLDLISGWILLGAMIDLFSMACIIGLSLGICDRPGYPIGPLFYIIGFCDSLLINGRPFVPCVLVLASCLVFYTMVVFSGFLVSYVRMLCRRIAATRRKVFYSEATLECSAQDTLDRALNCLICWDRPRGVRAGSVYLRSKCHLPEIWVERLASGDYSIHLAERDPGEIREGRFANWSLRHGFPIQNWKVGPRRQLIVPSCEQEHIRGFIDLVFSRYYRYGDDYQVKAEVLMPG
jgi:hypothetical protein